MFPPRLHSVKVRPIHGSVKVRENEPTITYNPVGRCIYCRNQAANLQREHIIPFGLGGTLILPEASCAECAKKTAAVEGFCLQTMFIDARLHLDMPSRRHRRNRAPPPALRAGHVGADREVSRWEELTKEKHPFALFTLDFSPAGILSGRPVLIPPKIVASILPSPQFNERMARLPVNASVGSRLDHRPFGRMLAKIAHAFAVAQYGLDGFEPLLPSIILGNATNTFYYVGGVTETEPRDIESLHTLESRKTQRFVLAYVRLFEIMGAPAYDIVVGRLR